MIAFERDHNAECGDIPKRRILSKCDRWIENALTSNPPEALSKKNPKVFLKIPRRPRLTKSQLPGGKKYVQFVSIAITIRHMPELSIPNAIARGYDVPSNTQFSVFLDNRVGKLLELVETLDAVALKIVAMSVVDSADHAVVRLLTSRSELARRLLQRHGLPFSETPVLVVGLDEGFSLAQLCDALLTAELNIYYAYSLIEQPHDQPAIVLHCDDPVLACQILRRRRFTLLGENDLGDNINPGDPMI